MVIQRVQTLYLLISAVLMILFITVIPVGHIGSEPIMSYKITPVLIVSILAAILILIDIFLFKNLKNQMRVCRISMLLVAATEAVIAVCYYAMPEFEPVMPALIWPVAFPVCSFIFLMLALSGMKRDHKVLTDYDHFR